MNSSPLPTGWRSLKISDVATRIKAGGTPARGIPEFWGGSIPFVKIEDMTLSGGELASTCERITEEGLKNSSAWLVPKDSVLLAMYASIGECSINRVEVATNQAIIALVPDRSVIVENY